MENSESNVFISDGIFLSSWNSVVLYPSVIVEEGLKFLETMMDDYDTIQEKTDLTKQEIKQLVRLCTEQPYFENSSLDFSCRIEEDLGLDTLIDYRKKSALYLDIYI